MSQTGHATTVEYLTFDELLNHWARKRPDTVAMEDGDRLTTYAQLEPMTRRIIAMLKLHGVEKGDRIAWYGKNSDTFFQLFFAAARYGAVIAPINWRLARAEVHYILRDTGAKLVVTGPEFIETARSIAEEMEFETVVLTQDEARVSIAAVPEAQFVAAGAHDAALQLYTSGTTGNPKGAVLSAANLLSLRQAAEQDGLAWTKWNADEAILAGMPCAHIGGTGLVVMTLAVGIRAFIIPEFTPDATIDSLDRGVTRFFIVPAALQMVVQHRRAKDADFSRLLYVMYGAAPMPLELLRKTMRIMPHTKLMQVFGMTETSGTVTMLSPEDHDPAGNERMRSCGKAVPGVEIAIHDEDGCEVPRGTIGEIAVRSPSNMIEYWNRPEATTETIDNESWLRTGDAAYMDGDGFIFIQDRIKDMIVTGGENVYPAEVENAIYGHPAIAEVAVIGIPDDKWGEAVKACIVCKPGLAVDLDSIATWTRDRIASFKCPKSVDIMDALPRNPTGKILRRALRAPYWEGRERQIN